MALKKNKKTAGSASAGRSTCYSWRGILPVSAVEAVAARLASTMEIVSAAGPASIMEVAPAAKTAIAAEVTTTTEVTITTEAASHEHRPAAVAMEPRTRANKNSVQKIRGTVVAIRRAGIRLIWIISIRAGRRPESDSDSHSHLRVCGSGRRCGHRNQNN
jgi:hypothetical protein